MELLQQPASTSKSPVNCQPLQPTGDCSIPITGLTIRVVSVDRSTFQRVGYFPFAQRRQSLHSVYLLIPYKQPIEINLVGIAEE